MANYNLSVEDGEKDSRYKTPIPQQPANPAIYFRIMGQTYRLTLVKIGRKGRDTRRTDGPDLLLLNGSFPPFVPFPSLSLPQSGS